MKMYLPDILLCPGSDTKFIRLEISRNLIWGQHFISYLLSRRRNHF
jgi:hypothetical protein